VLVTALLDGGAEAKETRVIVQAAPGTALDSGTRVGLAMPPERTYFFDAETGDVRNSRQRISL
jgi:sn-glycerol 3-phosphate transport system ATP-binding protein